MRAFEEIYAEYYALVYKYAMSLCANPAMAEEIAQESFYRAYRHIGSFRGGCKMSSWLCQIAKNVYLSHLKKLKFRGSASDQEIPDAADLEALFADRESATQIHRLLHRLKEPYKEVFWLRVFGEMEFKQIGELFEKSESWARVTYYRAKIKIREELE